MDSACISVIVPVYNVEQYLEQCVLSLVHQTYKNLEIILVDDGSTDNSGKQCDEYADQDKRIRVIHKENGGLSSARNAGMKVAKGDYIGFVDSDDYISESMYEDLMQLALQYHAEVVCGRHQRFGDVEDGESNESGEAIKFTGDEVLHILLHGDPRYLMTISVWDRLYKRELVEKLKFPDGKCYEDIVFTMKVMTNTNCCVYLDKTIYYYRIRKNSICGKDQQAATGVSQRIITDQIPQWEEATEFLTEAGKMKAAGEAHMILCNILIDCYLAARKADQNKIVCQLKKMMDHERKVIGKYRKYQESRVERIKGIIFSISPTLFYYIREKWRSNGRG